MGLAPLRLGSLCGLCLAVGACAVAGGPRDIRLPQDTAVLKASAAPGYDIARTKCGICHSADYINLQPPGMSLAQWSAEMVKMQRAYGAPIDDDDIKLLAVYLTTEYGDASTVAASRAP